MFINVAKLLVISASDLIGLFCYFLGTVSCTFFLAVSSLYSSSDDVIELTPTNFNREVIQSDSLWLVEFYAPW